VAIVCVMFGILAGYVIGYNVCDDERNMKVVDSVPYWFYVDYGDHETSELQNGWLLGKAGVFQPRLALQKVAEIIVNSNGELISVNGVGINPNSDEVWMIWLFPNHVPDLHSIWIKAGTIMDALNAENVFYIGLTHIDPVTHAPLLEPEWHDGGPFVIS